jgi:hypothetical protein
MTVRCGNEKQCNAMYCTGFFSESWISIRMAGSVETVVVLGWRVGRCVWDRCGVVVVNADGLFDEWRFCA